MWKKIKKWFSKSEDGNPPSGNGADYYARVCRKGKNYYLPWEGVLYVSSIILASLPSRTCRVWVWDGSGFEEIDSWSR